MMEKLRGHCASLCSNKSRFNFAIVSTLTASICCLSLRFSPSFLSLLLLIPSFLFLTHKKSHNSNRLPLTGEDRSSDDEISSSIGGFGSDHHLFDEMPRRTAEERSAAPIGEERYSDDKSSICNGGVGSSVDFDHHLYDEMPRRTAEERSAAIIEEDRSSEDESSSCDGGGLGSKGDFDSDDLWMCFDELARIPPFSDDSSSEDDDSLIEIPLLPNSTAKRTDLLTDSVLKQYGFVELFEEINEEDNLIEIDISRGFNRACTACN